MSDDSSNEKIRTTYRTGGEDETGLTNDRRSMELSGPSGSLTCTSSIRGRPMKEVGRLWLFLCCGAEIEATHDLLVVHIIMIVSERGST